MQFVRNDVDLDNRSLVVRVLSFRKNVALPYRIEQMIEFTAKAKPVEGPMLNERMEELKMLSKQIKE